MSCVRFSEGCAYIVSDGMGGHKGGARAAELTVRSLEQHLSAMPDVASIDESLKKAFAAANTSVYEAGHMGDPQTEGMGATAVVCVTTQSSALVAHVGDSRAYLHRRHRLTRLTRDHTRAQAMVDAGVLSPAEAERHPDASVLERAIGESEAVAVDVGAWLHLKKGDEILLCSDGLYGEADDLEIEEALQHDESPRRLVDRLVALALEKGGGDNVTVQLIRYRNRPIPWQPFRSQAVTLPILMLGGLTAIYFANARLEAALSREIIGLEVETRGLRASIDDIKQQSSLDLQTLKQELASMSGRIEQRYGTPRTGAGPRKASVKGKSVQRKPGSSARKVIAPVDASPVVPDPAADAAKPTSSGENKP